MSKTKSVSLKKFNKTTPNQNKKWFKYYSNYPRKSHRTSPFHMNGLEVSYNLQKGSGRPYMEDRLVIGKFMHGKTPYYVFAVFDGHGGDEVANLAKNKIIYYLYEEMKTLKSPSITLVENVIKKVFKRIDDKSKEEELTSGSTASLVLISKPHVWVAHVGDSSVYGVKVNKKRGTSRSKSRGHLKLQKSSRGRSKSKSKWQKVSPQVFTNEWAEINVKKNLLTPSHNIEHAEEKRRISRHRGYKFSGKYIQVETRKLAMTRALGDHDFGKAVLAQPNVKHYNYNEYNWYFIASDGIWDEVSIHDLWSQVKNSPTKDIATHINLWRQEHYRQHDNTSIITVHLKNS